MTQNSINSSNRIIQIAHASTSSLHTCSTNMPFDNTIPQNTEGTEVITLSITPKFSTSLLELVFSSCGIGNGTPSSMSVALFQDSTAAALSARGYNIENASHSTSCFLRHFMTSGTTSSTTFKIRIGPNSGTVYVNGKSAGTRLFGGVANTTLQIKEYIT